jgi:two-component system CheB/CheR fusion protein
MLIFSEQNVVKDPPFSRLDLISCRNFLIYLNKDLQKKVIGLFNYSLKTRGLLFLGNSENISEPRIFFALDLNSRLFIRNDDHSGPQRISIHAPFPVMAQLPQVALTEGDKQQIKVKKPLREIAEQALLTREDMAGVLVNNRGDIVYLHGRAGLYLEPAPGEAEMNNILKMAREGLKFELTNALHKAAEQREIVRLSGLRVKTNGHYTPVNISVHPLDPENTGDAGTQLYLVVLERGSRPAVPEAGTGQGGPQEELAVEVLRQQLRTKEEYLQAAKEELETANEELSSSNEEMQSINEELQSTNEELETSREELQSINEELSTVNAELQVKVSEVHGMSQRGGSVVTYVRAGEEVASPLVPEGEADLIIAFEQLEALRWFRSLKKGGKIIMNTRKIDPMPVITGAAEYPKDIEDKLIEKGGIVVSVDALAAAKKAGSVKTENLVMLGAASAGMGFSDQEISENL